MTSHRSTFIIRPSSETITFKNLSRLIVVGKASARREMIDSRASCIFILRSSERDCAVSDIVETRTAANQQKGPLFCEDHNQRGMKLQRRSASMPTHLQVGRRDDPVTCKLPCPYDPHIARRWPRPYNSQGDPFTRRSIRQP